MRETERTVPVATTETVLKLQNVSGIMPTLWLLLEQGKAGVCEEDFTTPTSAMIVRGQGSSLEDESVVFKQGISDSQKNMEESAHGNGVL